ncbi:Putative two-component response regulator [hydrothermal vent metagenome]|uniref:Putative two-component response regulator n=1 Tax=hydrothermal vent metagenome TaxID=652676 RepID=A0A1W1BLL0_9ZZZZ
MNSLKIPSLLLVGDSKEREYFKKYFNKIELVNNNREALSSYHKNLFSAIFLDCSLNKLKDSAFDISKKIRENDNQTVIVILANSLNRDRLKKVLPLHLSGYIERPFNYRQVENVLYNIKKDLKFSSIDITKFKDGYHFCNTQQIFYDSHHREIKLTKNELKLLNIFLKAKDNIITEESIASEIWEEEMWSDNSDEINYKNRLKNLLYNFRKKLPKNSISNSYNMGYKLIYS